jgi:hypothetical protein
MTPLQRILILLMATALLWLTFELLRKRRLREEYAVLWVCTGLMLLAFAAFPRTLFIVAAWVGLDHTVLMLLACFLFLMSIVMHYSVVISRHSDREKGLVQEVAFLRHELEELRTEVKSLRPPEAVPGPAPDLCGPLPEPPRQSPDRPRSK